MSGHRLWGRDYPEDCSIPERVELYLARMAKDPHRAMVEIYDQEAREKARRVQRAVEEGRLTGPLAGATVVLKDNLCDRGHETSCGSRMLQGYRPPYTATAVQRLRDAGAIVLGRGNMDEFAMGSTTETSCYGPTRNPHRPGHVPGGSSGGPAAAVAGGLAAFALGSDTGGSIRQPASHCGVVGLKPTYGAVSRRGLVAYASSLDQIGPLAPTARGCAAVLQAIAGRDAADSTSTQAVLPAWEGQGMRPLSGCKLGLPRACFGSALAQPVGEAVLAAAQRLETLGASLQEVELPSLPHAIPAYYILCCAEAASNLARYDGVRYGYRAEAHDLEALYTQSRSQSLGDEVKRRILWGNLTLLQEYADAYYRKAQRVRALLRREVDEALRQVDVLLLPVAPTTAPRLGESLANPIAMYEADRYTVLANLCGLPALSFPCGWADGLPIGCQLMGPAGWDLRLLDLAAAYEEG